MSNVRPHKTTLADFVSPGLILILNGTSSSGKTSIVTQLRAAAPHKFFVHVELDAFRAMEPAGYFGQDQRSNAEDRIKALCIAMQATAAAYSRNGQNVLVDHVLSTIAWAHLLQDSEVAQALLIKVQCELGVAEDRERRRGDRQVGLARSQFPGVHAGRLYDFEIDTTNSTSEAAAKQLATWLHNAPQPRALAAMRSGQSAA